MTFDRTDFEKNINLNSKKKVKIKSKYNIVKLSEYVIANGGNSFPKEYQNGKAGIPFLKVSDMNLPQNQRNIVCANNYVTISEIESMKAKVFDVNTIIFPKVGQAVHTDKKRILKVKACIDNNIMGLSTINDLLLPEYLYEIFVNHIRLSDIANSANPPAISATNIENVTVPLPPLEIQQKIVDEIEKIENENKKINEKINVLNQKVHDLLDKLSGKLIKLGDICESYIGLTYKPEEIDSNGVLVLRSSNIKNGKLDLIDQVRVNSKIRDNLYVKNGDVLVCVRNGSKRLLGKAAYIENINELMTFGAFMAICRSSIGKYIYIWMQSENYIKQVEKLGTTMSINQLTQKMLMNLEIPMLSEKDQQSLVIEYNELEKQIAEAQAMIDNSKQQKQEILDKYLK